MGTYKGELNINPVLKLIVLNEEELDTYLYNQRVRSARFGGFQQGQ